MAKKQTTFERLLDEKGIRRTTLAEKTGISYDRITRLVLKQLEPSIGEAHRIAAFFEKPVEEVFPEALQIKE
jgi:DNA-binding XRE family transcriptional regulator